jgi:hypothetical protein
MSPQGPEHAGVIQILTELLVSRLDGRASVLVQLPLATSEISEPEPGLAVVASGDYRQAHPTTGLLVIEVAVTSQQRDRIKMRLSRIVGRMGRICVDRRPDSA